MTTVLPTYVAPGLANIRALVTTRWGKGGYKARVITNITSYQIDTALDSDADQWQLVIPDPFLDMPELLARDNEVRVQLYGAGKVGSGYILSGIADNVEYTEQGAHTLVGRDLSALAIDNYTEPAQFRHIRANKLIEQQAKKLGFKRIAISSSGPAGKVIKKLQHTDGSETYWEFWYRMIRNEKMWLWSEPDGTLVGSTLNYDGPVRYYFGNPRSTDSAVVRKSYVPVDANTVRKSTANRFYEIWTGGHKGNQGFWRKATDPTIAGWQMKRRKFVVDKDAHTWNAAIKNSWEEIFEGKVGAVEWNLTILDPGFLVKQNNIAFVNLPEIGLSGRFFVVGVQASASEEGLAQTVRLREVSYAVTRRVPEAPTSVSSSEVPSAGASGIAQQLGEGGDVPPAWSNYFVKAAKNWCGPWDFNLFLACLLAMCKQETNFRNIRENGGPGGDGVEWYERPTPGTNPSESSRVSTVVAQWQTQFANESGDGIVTREYGVGPMQLTTRGFKYEADDRMRTNFRSEFEGGRWHPEHNIWVAAHVLRSALQDLVHDSGRDIDIWNGVAAYNAGVANYQNGLGYAASVRRMVNQEFLPAVKTARDEAVAAANAEADNPSPSDGYQNAPNEIAKLNWIAKSTPQVDIEHVDYRLLQALNSLGKSVLKTVTINSGFRTFQQQVAAWNDYQKGGAVAANPYTSTSNHQLGRACDCYIGQVGLRSAVNAAQLAKFHLAAAVPSEDWHVTMDDIPNAGH